MTKLDKILLLIVSLSLIVGFLQLLESQIELNQNADLSTDNMPTSSMPIDIESDYEPNIVYWGDSIGESENCFEFRRSWVYPYEVGYWRELNEDCSCDFHCEMK